MALLKLARPLQRDAEENVCIHPISILSPDNRMLTGHGIAWWREHGNLTHYDSAADGPEVAILSEWIGRPRFWSRRLNW